MFTFARAPNPQTERQKFWNLENILREWQTVGANGAPPIFPIGDDPKKNLFSLLGCLAGLENCNSRRQARELFESGCALLDKSDVRWQVSRNDFLWGELFARYGSALGISGESWLGEYVAALAPRELHLPVHSPTAKETAVEKALTRDFALTGDWLRDREEATEPLQKAICDYLLSADPAGLLSHAAKAPPLDSAELRLLALYRGDTLLLGRIARFSSLAKKLPEAGILRQLHTLEEALPEQIREPRDWLAAGEALSKYLDRDLSQRRVLLTLAFVCRKALAKRNTLLANFLFHSYSKVAGGHLDPYGLALGEEKSFLPVSTFARGSSLLNLTKELGLLLGKQRLTKLFRPNRRLQLSELERQTVLQLVAREMGRLKGPVMKLGQMVSYLGTDLSPSERSLFDHLWSDSAPLPFGVVVTQLSKVQRAQFREIDPTPLGCGSVSQVHRAVLHDGGEVALKILLPDLPSIMRSDFQILRTILPVARWLMPDLPLAEFYQEMKLGLEREMDFGAEAQALSKLRDRFRVFPDICVPELISEVSDSRIVAMSLERGQDFRTFIAEASQQDRDRAGQAIVRFVVTSVKEKFFNSDPHPGNYLFNGPRVTFLDFGAAAAWDSRTSESWNQLILAFLHYDIDRFTHALKLVNCLSSRATKEDIRSALDFFAKPQEGFWNTGTVSALDPDISVRQIQGLMKSFNGRHAPVRLYPKFLFGMRVYLGHIHIVARLGARANWKDLVEEIFST